MNTQLHGTSNPAVLLCVGWKIKPLFTYDPTWEKKVVSQQVFSHYKLAENTCLDISDLVCGCKYWKV